MCSRRFFFVAAPHRSEKGVGEDGERWSECGGDEERRGRGSASQRRREPHGKNWSGAGRKGTRERERCMCPEKLSRRRSTEPAPAPQHKCVVARLPTPTSLTGEGRGSKKKKATGRRKGGCAGCLTTRDDSVSQLLPNTTHCLLPSPSPQQSISLVLWPPSKTVVRNRIAFGCAHSFFFCVCHVVMVLCALQFLSVFLFEGEREGEMRGKGEGKLFCLWGWEWRERESVCVSLNKKINSEKTKTV